MGIDVVYLIGVTSGENDHVVLQVVNVETFVGGHAIAPEELIVAAGYRGIWDRLFNMILRVVLIYTHDLFLDQDLSNVNFFRSSIIYQNDFILGPFF